MGVKERVRGCVTEWEEIGRGEGISEGRGGESYVKSVRGGTELVRLVVVVGE